MHEPSKSQNDGGHLRGVHLLVLAALLALPVVAAWRVLGSAGPWIGGWCAAASLFAFIACWHDKRSARAQTWRTSEGTLHLLELLGGWPGAFLAQQWFRHKTVKVSYQAVFWLIVAIYQFLAIDALRGWPLVPLLGKALKVFASR